MLATEPPRLIEEDTFLIQPPVKKLRTVSSSICTLPDSPVSVRNLELESVKELFMDYDLLEAEAVSCVICGKNYKSKVCVKKHLWEHSVYWDLFDGLKKQQRVLSIQAAIILAIKFHPSLSLLLVTNSSSGTKKHKAAQEKQQPAEKTLQSLPVTQTTSTPSYLHRKRKSDGTSALTPPPTTQYLLVDN